VAAAFKCTHIADKSSWRSSVIARWQAYIRIAINAECDLGVNAVMGSGHIAREEPDATQSVVEGVFKAVVRNWVVQASGEIAASRIV
jgi:hypothetical protein